MELCVLPGGKLRILLTSFDLVRYDVDVESLDYGNTKTRKAVWEILDTARERTGFDAADGRIFIQVYPRRNGGCEMVITKLESLPPGNEVNETVCDGKKESKTKTCVYAFSDLEELLAVCRKLKQNGYRAESDAYIEGEERKSRYFLSLKESGGRGICDALFVGEYGARMTGAEIGAFLREHGTLLCEKNAVEMLSDL